MECIADRYDVLGLLGHGGMADVYRVRERGSGTEFALKRLRVSGIDRARRALALFEREYQILNQLAHPAVVQAHDYGVDERGAYYTMELLAGADMRGKGPMPWLETCRVLRDIASVLAVLHSRRWLHRDISPRNVFRTQDGVIKLLDFGALTPIGVAKSLIGTPPFVPPEAVQQQSLDARADLYALGALGYYLLVGQHAFPARSFADLRDRWRSALRPPERVVSEIPPALGRLVLELLSLDRFARPASAAAVLERIDAMLGANGQVGPAPEALGRAFLTTPRLIGRDAELSRVRKLMVRALRGRGSAILIEGRSGCGRSRLLDACVLEAKLMGASVLRVDAGDGGGRDYGAIASIGEQLLQTEPLLAREAAGIRRPLLATVIGALRHSSVEAQPEDIARPERRHLQAALRDWFRTVARDKRVVIAVDDAERIDEPSLAVLAALAHKCERRRLSLVLTAERAAIQPALTLLRDAAQGIPLSPLAADTTEALLGSLFGDASHVASLASRVFELSGGNPREIMALAEHLVEQGLARYAAGSWSLPARFEAEQLPKSMEDAFSATVGKLPPEARALSQALALAEATAWSPAACGVMCEEASRPRLFELLDTLVQAGVVVVEGESYRLAHGQWRQPLLRGLPPERARELHARLARALEDSGQDGAGLVEVARHMFEGGQELAAIDRLLAARAEIPLHGRGLLELLVETQGAAPRLQLDAAAELRLRIWLIEAAAVSGRLDIFTRLAGGVVEQLQRLSGLHDYASLSPSDGEGRARMLRAVAAAQARNEEAPAHERSLSPPEAIRQLLALAVSSTSLAVSALDVAVLDILPNLGPLGDLTPSAALVEHWLVASRAHLSGRLRYAREVFIEILQRLDAPDGAGLPEDGRRRMRQSALYGLGVLEAVSGRDSALERVVELEESAGFRVNAWRIRTIHQVISGDLDEAARCERRAQLFLLQDGGRPLPASDLQAEANVRVLSDDLEGLKQMLGRLRDAGEVFPARRAVERVVYCQYLRLKGEPERALEELLPVLREHNPDKPERFSPIGAAHLMLLNALGRHDEAAAAGLDYLARLGARGVELLDCSEIVRALSESLAYCGDVEQAVRLSEQAIKGLKELGNNALVLGSWCETRARIALIARDADAFELWIDRCMVQYRRIHNRALAAKLSLLLRQARELHLLGPLESDEMISDESQSVSEPGTVMSLMAECVGLDERVRCALRLLAEDSGASHCHLFGWLGGQLSHLASLPAGDPPEGVAGFLEHVIEREVNAAEVTATDLTLSVQPASQPLGLGHDVRPVLLTTIREGEPVIAGAVLLERAGYGPSRELLTAVADSLLEHDDVDALCLLT